MYPSGALAELAERKRLLRASIALRRSECQLAAADLARPIGWIDRGVELWHRFSPMLKILLVPGAFAVGKILRGRAHGGNGAASRPRGKIATVMAALPLIMRGVKLVSALRAKRSADTTATL